MKIYGWAILAALTIAIAGCGSSDSSSTASTSAATTEPPKVIAHDVENHTTPGEGFDLVVGHAHHVTEASTDAADARMIIHAREGKVETFDKSPAGVINEMYAKDTYRSYGRDGLPAAPLCTIADQEPVEVDGYDDAALLNAGGTREPAQCSLADGTTLYVSAWEK